MKKEEEELVAELEKNGGFEAGVEMGLRRMQQDGRQLLRLASSPPHSLQAAPQTTTTHRLDHLSVVDGRPGHTSALAGGTDDLGDDTGGSG